MFARLSLAFAFVTLPLSPQDAPSSSLAFVLDLDQARALGWGSEKASAEEVMSAAAGTLRRRLVALDDRFHVEMDASQLRLRVTREPALPPRKPVR